MNYKKLFEKFHLYEFIKNQFSWHSVKRIDAPSNFLRRSINNNIFLFK